jgi:MerR family copper efflux transcriptional regulator
VTAEGARALMTVGELSRRTGLSRKAIRDLEGRGLIYSAGRSKAGYRLFDESALWCVQVIRNLRFLGLTVKEIEQIVAVYLDRPGRSIGPELAAALDRSERRIDERLGELTRMRERVRAYREQNADALRGASDLVIDDPRRNSPRDRGAGSGAAPGPRVR